LLQLQANEDEKYAFVVEWYDPQATLVRQYVLHFYEHDGTVEMVHIV
jgi:nucleoside-diphosphate kinase